MTNLRTWSWLLLLAVVPPVACTSDFRTKGDDSSMGGQGGSAGAQSWPECIEEEEPCPGCETSEDCEGGVCDPETEQCVACLENAHCADTTAPRCDDNACGDCVDAEDCARFSEETVCDEESGACVACLDEDDCSGSVCDPSTKTCTDLPARELNACEECQHDAQCQEGQLCVEMTYHLPEDGVVGTFCLWRVDAPQPGPNGSCGSPSAPFASLATVKSVDGLFAEVCTLRSTTCPALLHHGTEVDGCEIPFTDDAACGHPDFSDGRCRLNTVQEPRCTYPCLGHEDCRAGSSCLAGGDSYCSM